MQKLERRSMRNATRPTILVIDDEREICAILGDELSHMGYRVVMASDGMEGLDMIQEAEPDLIICDRVMPSMTGTDLFRRLRNLYPQYNNVPFIFITALTDPRDKLEALELGPFAYMEKPIDFRKLHETIKQALH